MSKDTKLRLIIVTVGALVVGSISIGVARRGWAEVVRSANGTITAIDPVTRMASLDIVHPKTGDTIHLAGSVDPACRITVDGAPVEIGDLHAGDQASIQARIGAHKKITALQIEVHRRKGVSLESTATQPVASGPEL